MVDVDAVLAVQRRAATALLLLTGTYLGSVGPVAVPDEALVGVDRALVDLGDYFDACRRRPGIGVRWWPDHG
ncbi:MAG: hypothetical protein H7Y15_07975 [Pseudonocardia sp.]|nr:hypothetical protein [Pseudonocardia sp.]